MARTDNRTGPGWGLPTGFSIGGVVALLTAAWLSSRAIATRQDLTDLEQRVAAARATNLLHGGERLANINRRIDELRKEIDERDGEFFGQKDWRSERQLLDMRMKQLEDRIKGCNR